MSNPINPTLPEPSNEQELITVLAEAQQNEDSLNHELGLMVPKNITESDTNKWQSLFRILRNMYLNDIIIPEDTLEIQQAFYKLDLEQKQNFLSNLMAIFDKRLNELELENQLLQMELIDRDFDEKYELLPDPMKYLMIKFAKGEIEPEGAAAELEVIQRLFTVDKYDDALTVFNEIKEQGLRFDKDQPEDTIPNTRPGTSIITQMTPKMVSPERLREIIAGNKSRQQLQPASEITPTQVPLEAPVQLPQIRQQPPAQNPKTQIPTQPRARVSQTPPAFPVRNSAAYRNLPGVVRPGSK